MNKTLVLIFKPNLESKELEVLTAAIADYSQEKSDYIISTGYFSGFGVSDFNRMLLYDKSNPFKHEANNNNKLDRLAFSNRYDDNSELVFMFEPIYLKSIAETLGISFEEACLIVAKDSFKHNIYFDADYGTLDKNAVHSYKTMDNDIKVDENKVMGMLEYSPFDPYASEDTLRPFENNSREKALELIEDIRKKIVGQDEATITLVTNILYNQQVIDEVCSEYNYDPSELDSRKVGILLDGTTGTGKTAIEKMIANKLDLPIVIVNANSFSETGYVGPSITDILRKLYFVSNREITKAERGIVVLDEIDKLATKDYGDGKDMKKGVQEELLGFISGGEYDVQLDESRYNSSIIHFDTSKLTFILSGAFTHLRERKIDEIERQKKKTSIGFGISTEEEETVDDRTYTITAQDYVDEGLNREFFGRIKVLACTKTYAIEDLKNILLTSDISPLKNLNKTVQMYGYSGIVYDEEFVDEVCIQAYEMQTGARALQTIISGIQNRLLMGLFNQTYDLEKPIELTTGLLHEYNMTLIRHY